MKIKVFKFGGASLRTSDAIRNASKIVGIYSEDPEEKLLIVASAMGKTTNALEKLLELSGAGKSFEAQWQQLRDYHLGIMKELFAEDDPVFKKIDEQFEKIKAGAAEKGDYDMVYDQVVSHGEIISTIILASFLAKDFPVEWIDATKYVKTNSNFREARVQWPATEKAIAALKSTLANKIIVTQGFIGGEPEGKTTTLGRDGSDYSAAVFASGLGAESVTIWKDVPGVMNADPKRLEGAVVFEELPFKEAAEMTYYGASVIHPKTIKPLANRNIPLYVKNFDDPSLPGTRINECVVKDLPPLIVFKENQCLISCKVTDYTFIDEQQLSAIFQSLAKMDVKINLMQNSAISFSFCVDFREQKILNLIEVLSAQFEVYYNTGLTLITIKNFDNKTFNEFRKKPGIILEQSSRSTLQLLMK
ncbi:MAG TPA: aspartate kinase [Cyclobacteriaceae bacterium]|nr:aspartate kinase [Cyclobacteriaceae bacterium]